MSSPREFWILPRKGDHDGAVFNTDTNSFGHVHVIEFSAVQKLQAQLDEAVKVLSEIANEDFRGNRSKLSVKAEKFLASLRKESK